jgi:hypothetical protein
MRGAAAKHASAYEEVQAALQNVFRLHAGVTHTLDGDRLVASTASSRRPRVTAVLLAVGALGGTVGLSSLPIGLLLAAGCLLPLCSLPFIPVLGMNPPATADWLALAVPGALSIALTLHLALSYRAAGQGSATRVEAAAISLATSSTEIRALMASVVAMSFTVSLLGPAFVQGSARLMLIAGVWGFLICSAVFPLLLPGRLGRLIMRHAAVPDADVSGDVTLPVRIDSGSPVESPHLELPATRRRARHAS